MVDRQQNIQDAWASAADAYEAKIARLLDEVGRLQDALRRYGDRFRMLNAPAHLQQTIYEALASPDSGGEAEPECRGKGHDDPEHHWQIACVHCGVFRGSDLYATPPASAPVTDAMVEAAAKALPSLPDDDSDFTPELARKIIAKYQEYIAALAPRKETGE